MRKQPTPLPKDAIKPPPPPFPPMRKIIEGVKIVVPESDPHNLDPHSPGAKLDDGKVMAGLLEDFSLALWEVAKVCTHGAKKYSVGGWQFVPDGVERYKHAAWRHKLQKRYEEVDKASGLKHEAQEVWNLLAALELKLRAKREIK